MYPDALIQIDKNIYPIVRELNRKGYITEACCEGHISEKREYSNNKIYISFKKTQKFKIPLPKGFAITADTIWGSFGGDTNRAKKIKKTKMLNDLYLWVKNLEVKCKYPFFMGKLDE